MIHLLVDEPFTSHSGLRLSFKIDADALTDADIATVARVVASRGPFGIVYGVPRGGLRFAGALRPYVRPGAKLVLIVDDVLTAGASMREMRRDILHNDPGAIVEGIVLFSRGPCPAWISPFFTLHEAWCGPVPG